MKTVRYRFEREIERVTDNNKAKTWLRAEYKTILESDKGFTRKTDYIGLSIISIDEKVKGIDEEIKELQELKKGLKTAKEIALEVGSEVFHEYGIEKLEGTGVSSISITEPSMTSKLKLNILDHEALINAGFYKKIVDEELVLELMSGADERKMLQEFCEVDILIARKPSKLKVNKRRNKKVEYQELEVAS